MGITLFKIFAIFGTVSAWSDKALEDGIVTAQEAADLGIQLADKLGLPTEIDVASLLPPVAMGSTVEESARANQVDKPHEAPPPKPLSLPA